MPFFIWIGLRQRIVPLTGRPSNPRWSLLYVWLAIRGIGGVTGAARRQAFRCMEPPLQSTLGTRYKNRNTYNVTMRINHMSEDATSTRLDDGSIGCSRCKLPLTEVRSPFYIRKEYVGHFDSLDCPLCHFHIFTEKGYDDAMQMAHRYGLVGPPEEEVEMC